MPDRRVAAIVNFYGGAVTGDCPGSLDALVKASGLFGERTSAPSIWLYGDNDRLFPKPTWEAMYAAYTKSGAHEAELVAFGRYGAESHRLLASLSSLKIVSPRLDAFLERHGLPHSVSHPDYLPMPAPTPTGFATVEDVDKVPYLTPETRKLYENFLRSSHPRVFLIAPGKFFAGWSGGFDPLARGLDVCRSKGATCIPYAVDDDVVWKRPGTPPPPPSGFARLDDVAILPVGGEPGRDAYRRFLPSPKPRAFVISRDGASASAWGGLDPVETATGLCAKTHDDCRAYAVDDDVVWKTD